jgi:hypothetical protein
MAEPSFMVALNFNVFGRYFSFQTPDFWREEHRPRLLPTWEFIDLREGAGCEVKLDRSKMFMFDWLFHFCAVYGPSYDASLEYREEDPEQHW